MYTNIDLLLIVVTTVSVTIGFTVWVLMPLVRYTTNARYKSALLFLAHWLNIATRCKSKSTLIAYIAFNEEDLDEALECLLAPIKGNAGKYKGMESSLIEISINLDTLMDFFTEQDDDYHVRWVSKYKLALANNLSSLEY